MNHPRHQRYSRDLYLEDVDRPSWDPFAAIFSIHTWNGTSRKYLSTKARVPSLFSSLFMILHLFFSFVLLLSNFFHQTSEVILVTSSFFLAYSWPCPPDTFLAYILAVSDSCHFSCFKRVLVSCSQLYIPSAQQSSQIISVNSRPSLFRMLPGIIS